MSATLHGETGFIPLDTRRLAPYDRQNSLRVSLWGFHPLAQSVPFYARIARALFFDPMKRHVITALLLAATWCVQADVISGKVVRVADGDTITVLDGQMQQHKIRLAGIDAPERRQAVGQH